jgi:hypothetical protein
MVWLDDQQLRRNVIIKLMTRKFGEGKYGERWINLSGETRKHADICISCE